VKAAALLLTLCLPAAGCAASPPEAATAASPSRAAAEPEILEAVFRYQFDHNASGVQKRAQRYCLSVAGEKPPDAELLHRFEGNQPPVVAADRCDKSSGKDLFFRVSKIEWIKDGEVWVRGGYFEGNLSASLERYRVLLKDGRWVVEGAQMEAIS
jgi:hypothetical protein